MTEQNIRQLVREELVLQEENVYQLTASDIVKIVYSDDDRKVFSHIKNVASKLGLADNPFRKPFAPSEGGRKAFGGPMFNGNAMRRRLKRLGFDENEIGQMQEAFYDAAQRAANATATKYPAQVSETSFEPLQSSFVAYGFPRPQDYDKEVTEFFHSRVRFLAEKNLERLDFIY